MPTAPDRLPPHCNESEKGFLGSMLQGDSMVINDAISAGFKSEMFYDLRHQTIWDAVCQMIDLSQTPDTDKLFIHLRDKGLVDKVGGVSYIAELAGCSPSSSNWSYYGQKLREKFLLRSMLTACTNGASEIYNCDGKTPEEVIASIESAVMAVGQTRQQNSLPGIRELVMGALTDIEQAWERKGALKGIASGFPDLDRLTDGFDGGQMIVIAGRPSMGKTSFAMNIAEHVAVEQRIPTGIFSMEMTSRQLVERSIYSQARINSRAVRQGMLSERDFPKISHASARISKAPLFIDDTSGLTIAQIRSRGRRMVQQHGVKIFLIDYLQLIIGRGTGRRPDNRQQEIAEISCGVKNMAKELGVPVIVLCQLNREMDKDKNRKPRMSDLRESGAIEQDADFIGMLYRRATGEEDAEPRPEEPIPVNLLIAKQRSGPAGVDVKFLFYKEFTRFENVARVNDEDVPAGNTDRMSRIYDRASKATTGRDNG